jgi:uncharacterized protein
MLWQSIVLYFILILPILYLITCVSYLFLHRFFILFPSRKLSATPSDYKLTFEEVFFHSRDKVRLYGWLINGDPSGNCDGFTVLLFPGNKGTMSDFLLQIKQLTGIGFNVFLFSYRGFGKSQKKWPTEKGVYKDSDAACEYLLREKNIPIKKIIFLGQSLGCAMAALTASKYNPGALILEGGFPSIAEVAARAVKWLPLKRLTISRFETKEFLTKVICPVLIIHSRDDRAIPLSDADILLHSVKGKKKMTIISGPHAKGLEYDSGIYKNELKIFLSSPG